MANPLLSALLVALVASGCATSPEGDHHCPEGMTFNECGSGCGPSSCENLPRDICPRICRAGCFCPEGLVKDQDGGDRCIPLDHCQDRHCPDGMAYDECGSGCGPSSCENLPRDICPRICRAGCFCPEGLVKDQDGGDRCIPLDHCQDRHCPDGMAYDECGSGCGPFSCDNLPRYMCPRICRAGCFCPEGLVKDQDGGDRCIPLDQCQGSGTGAIRLVGGSNEAEGRVEIHYNGVWGTICDDSWGITDASVVCRMLGFQGASGAPGSAHFGQGTGPIQLDDVRCRGAEQTIFDCFHLPFGVHNCFHSEDAGVVCNAPGGTEGDVRLVGGSNEAEGRVEIQYNGVWGTICDDSWGITDASVVCRMLGFQGASGAPGSAHFGQGTGPIQLDDVGCTGAEQTIFDCAHPAFGVHNCAHYEDAGVVCIASQGDPLNCPVTGEWFVDWDASYECLSQLPQSNPFAVPGQILPLLTVTDMIQAAGAAWTADNLIEAEGEICVRIMPQLGAAAFGADIFRQYCDPVLTSLREGTTLNAEEHCRLILNLTGFMTTIMSAPTTPQPDGPTAEPDYPLGIFALRPFDFEGELESIVADQFGVSIYDVDNICRARQFVVDAGSTLEELVTDFLEAFVEVLIPRAAEICNSWNDIIVALEASSSGNFSMGSDFNIRGYLNDVSDFVARWAGYESREAMCQRLSETRGDSGIPALLDNIAADVVDSILSVLTDAQQCSTIVQEGLDLALTYIPGLDPYALNLQIYQITGMNGTNQLCQVVADAFQPGDHHCPEGMTFNECGSGCGPGSCDNLVPRDICPLFCFVGCFCPEGLVKDQDGGDRCIPVDQCQDYCDDVIVNCLVNPCDVSVCSAYPDAECRSNYCGGCNADFYVDDVQVNCSTCPEGMAFNECGSGCGPFSCDNLPSDICPRICSAGCFCPEGLVKDQDGGDRCIPLDQCQGSGTGAIRLVGGSNEAEGRVEIQYNGVWGTICDDSWGITDANVVCRMLGFQGASGAPGSAHFGQGTGPIQLDDVRCRGAEQTIFDCFHLPFGVHNCFHSEDAGVVCNAPGGTEGDVRLVGGSNEAEGRVEIQYNGVWGTICDDSWDITDASVVCRMLGFQGASGAPGSAQFGQGTGVIQLDDVGCTGAEQTIFDCAHPAFGVHNCAHYEDAGVACIASQDVRLVGGSNEAEGRVEIQYNGVWGTICDDSWGITDASVVCRMLGFQGASGAPGSAQFGQGTGPIQLDDVGCTGAEQTIFDCAHPAFGVHNCVHYEDAGVVCIASQDVRLVGGSNEAEGRVEIQYNGVWGTICDDSWDITDASVVCRMLGFQGASGAPGSAQFGQGTGLIQLDDVGCTGAEQTIFDCAHPAFGVHNCAHYEDAGVVCITSQDVRLVGGSNEAEGRVEIQYNEVWGTICDDSWGITDASVVCRMLGFQGASGAPGSAHFGQGTGPIQLDDVGCTGAEQTIFDCAHPAFGVHNCAHYEDAGVVCITSQDVRLVGGSNEAEGRVEIQYNGVWGTICDDSWGITDASVVCRMLGFQGASGAPGSAHFGQGIGPIQLDDVGCTGAEQSIFDCAHPAFGVHNCAHYEDAGVVCIASQDVRLVDGSNEAEGRVEIQYNGVWGTICDDSWDITDASVVCRMLGFQGASGAPGSAQFGQGTGPIQLDDVGCTGAEQTIFDCAHPPFGVHNCFHSEDAGVVCIA
ncbi:scavenger receptor cysteine-rich protein isoform X1 [Strongylocentrotus purpuratus]|uniref:SRCR domain-containing protein n=1 Tax=Strongylocentrotus purpuratus TaxID=7668 RepID=A0A7M7P180_STRPU|nr:scavenger receptor cysteine-rich protein isoform X1 [Strongylocentrotus purpuratus]XP_030844629.1 scavenger receptor cysteine-rich protein isoform X1 [Strongylocentrotus purpuratus]